MSQAETNIPPDRAARPPSDGRGIPLFRVFGIQIRLDWSWLIIFFVFVFIVQQLFEPALRGEPEWAVWLLSVISVVALFLCVLAHELGHSLVAMRHGIQMFDITLFIFGGMARLRGEPKTANDELKIALAGPAVTVVLAAVFWLAWWGLRPFVPLIVAEGIRWLAYINTALLVFNLIPGFPLDGGRVLRAILWKVRGNLLGATRAAATGGKIFAGVLIFLGLLAMLQQLWVAGLFYVFLGWFLGNAANQSVQHLEIRRLLEAFHVADAMERNIITVSSEMPLDRLVREGFYQHHFKSFPVLSDGRYCGLISLGDVQKVPSENWPGTTVRQAMPAASGQWHIRADDGLYDAFRRMGEEDIGRLVVVDHDQRVIGLISRRDVMKFMQIRSGLSPAGPGPQQAIPVAEDQASAGSDRPALSRPRESRRIRVGEEPPAGASTPGRTRETREIE